MTGVSFSSLLRCPICHSALRESADDLRCEKDGNHAFPRAGQYIVFTEANPGKYDADYAERYAFLWSYGYETRHSGLVESLYRSVGSLAAEALAEMREASPAVIDCGCGTGRAIADASLLVPSAQFLGVDLSPAKLTLASRILLGSEPVVSVLPQLGFETPQTIRGRGLKNVTLARADALSLPVKDGSADLTFCVNLLDRVDDPERAVRELRRTLRRGGGLILTTPLNWGRADLWTKFPDGNNLVEMIRQCGFEIRTWFDQLIYREALDRRGSVEEFTTLVISARAA